MAVQQNKKSRSTRDMCCSHDVLESNALSMEKSTGEVHLCHHVSPDSSYRGYKVANKGPDEQSLSVPVIVIDTMGGDFGPHCVVPVSIVLLVENSYSQLILAGQPALFGELLSRYPPLDRQRLCVYAVSEVIGSDERSSQALRGKPDVSMRVTLGLARGGRAHTRVSVGNTGALMVLSRRLLKTLPDISCPTMVTAVPAEKGHCHLLDFSADTDCSVEHPYQSAVIDAVATEALGCASPRVVLFNVGTEEIGGSWRARLAAGLLQKAQGLNFSGYIESNDLYRGEVDVVVCDGFVGNILLEVSEGPAVMVPTRIGQHFRDGLAVRLVGALALPLLHRLRGDTVPARYNGASLLELQGAMVKGHGFVTGEGFRSVLCRAALKVQENLSQRLHGCLEHLLLQHVTGRSGQPSSTQFPAPVAAGVLSPTNRRPQRAYSVSTSLAFVFLGQDSQSLGTLAKPGVWQALVRGTFAEASEALGYDPWALVRDGSEEYLNQADKTQLTILMVSIALWCLWPTSDGARPASVAGHSLDEYSALVTVGSLTFTDAVKLVERRGQSIQQAIPAGQGGMAVILGLGDADVSAARIEAAQGEVVSMVNSSASGQVVTAGVAATVERATETCEARGAKCAVALSVSVPSHCRLMRPATERLAISVESLQRQVPRIMLVQNISATVLVDPGTLRHDLLAQLYSPVRWVGNIQLLAEKGVIGLVECEPGKTLTSLNGRCAKGINARGLNGVEAPAAAYAALV